MILFDKGIVPVVVTTDSQALFDTFLLQQAELSQKLGKKQRSDFH